MLVQLFNLYSTQGYRLRETDLRLKQKETSSSSSNVSAVLESPSKSSSLTYKDLRLAGYSGTKYDAEMLISQGLADGICPPQRTQPPPAAVSNATAARSPLTTVNTPPASAVAVIKDLPSGKRAAPPPRQPPPNPPPPPPQVSIFITQSFDHAT